MGGEQVIKPMVKRALPLVALPCVALRAPSDTRLRTELCNLHATDPLTAPWFGADKPWNTRSPAEVERNVFTFFSAGIGGPHKYEGRSMVEAHEEATAVFSQPRSARTARLQHAIDSLRILCADAQIEAIHTGMNAQPGCPPLPHRFPPQSLHDS